MTPAKYRARALFRIETVDGKPYVNVRGPWGRVIGAFAEPEAERDVETCVAPIARAIEAAEYDVRSDVAAWLDKVANESMALVISGSSALRYAAETIRAGAIEREPPAPTTDVRTPRGAVLDALKAATAAVRACTTPWWEPSDVEKAKRAVDLLRRELGERERATFRAWLAEDEARAERRNAGATPCSRCGTPRVEVERLARYAGGPVRVGYRCPNDDEGGTVYVREPATQEGQ